MVLYTSDFLSLLTHCPNVEYIHIKGSMEPDDSNTLVNLPNLLLLRVTDRHNSPGPFVTDRIKTPNLQEVKINSYCWHAVDEWRAFFRQNQAIKTLTIPADLHFLRQIREAPNIQDLTMLVRRSNTGTWLLELAKAEANGSSEGDRSRICPHLRTLTILFARYTTPPEYSFFEKLIRSRYVPTRRIDGELYTETGYKALELLVLKFPSTGATGMEIMETESWGGAEVEKIYGENDVEYRLRWPYRDVGVGDDQTSKDSS
jgi:hypothetical protein